MAVEQVLTTILKATPAVTAVFGSNPLRLYPIQIKQGSALPALAYQRITTPRTTNLKGKSTLAAPLVQLTVQAQSYSAASMAADVLRNTLEGYHGVVNGTNVNMIIWRDSENNEFDTDSLLINWFIEITVWLNE